MAKTIYNKEQTAACVWCAKTIFDGDRCYDEGSNIYTCSDSCHRNAVETYK